jgi:hypothetical protein
MVWAAPTNNPNLHLTTPMHNMMRRRFGLGFSDHRITGDHGDLSRRAVDHPILPRFQLVDCARVSA